VGGATSISTIFLIDVEVGGFPPNIYVSILEKDIQKNYNWSFN
jgi:hypothetical protein